MEQKIGGMADAKRSAMDEEHGNMTIEKIKAAAEKLKEIGPPIDITFAIGPMISVIPDYPDERKPHKIIVTTTIGPFDTKADAVEYMQKKFPKRKKFGL